MASKTLKVLSLIVLSLPFYAEAAPKPIEWQIRNKTWTPAFEASYGDFIATLGKAKKAGACKTTNECLRSPKANPRFYAFNPPTLRNVLADCADFPYILRAYFSWMNDLPFSYPIGLVTAGPGDTEAQIIRDQIVQLELEMQTAGFFKKRALKGQIEDLQEDLAKARGAGIKGDIRYNKYGNIITEKRYVSNGVSFNDVLVEIAGKISTASFRTDASSNITTQLFRDTYPVEISTRAIKPGTVLYDANGHVAVVYEVTRSGKIHLIDAHPDNSITNITYGEKFARTNVAVGAGFANWRPFTFDNGKVMAASNNQLPDYSLIQFQKGGVFSLNGVNMSFHEYVRNSLSSGTLEYQPVEELSELLDQMCNDVTERHDSVKAAINAKIPQMNHPEKLPKNIYGTEGEWENHSSPSRDARLRASMREGRKLVIKMIDGYRKSDSSIIYRGRDLVADLKNTYLTKTKKCVIPVKKTNGVTMSLSLQTILNNIYKLSFDPYHCVELRWGLTDAESLKSCAQSKDKLDWFNAEQGLRNRIDRDYSMRMDYTASELLSAPVSDVKQEDISIENAIK